MTQQSHPPLHFLGETRWRPRSRPKPEKRGVKQNQKLTFSEIKIDFWKKYLFALWTSPPPYQKNLCRLNLKDLKDQFRCQEVFGPTQTPDGDTLYPGSAAILSTGGVECDPKGSMTFLQNQFRCPPMLGARRTSKT